MELRFRRGEAVSLAIEGACCLKSVVVIITSRYKFYNQKCESEAWEKYGGGGGLLELRDAALYSSISHIVQYMYSLEAYIHTMPPSPSR